MINRGDNLKDKLAYEKNLATFGQENFLCLVIKRNISSIGNSRCKAEKKNYNYTTVFFYTYTETGREDCCRVQKQGRNHGTQNELTLEKNIKMPV